MESSRGSVSPRAVLVVDDNLDTRDRIASGLRRLGFEVAMTGASTAAFQSACDLSPSVIVVVLDQATGGGLPLLRQLATDSRTQKIPVVVTRCDDESLRLRAQRLGTVGSLLGDCSAETLASELDRVIQESANSPGPSAHTGFPVPCPKCAAWAGVPKSVSTTANGGTYISLQCKACAQEWRVFRRADTLGFFGKT